jgi:hypothetical protein
MTNIQAILPVDCLGFPSPSRDRAAIKGLDKLEVVNKTFVIARFDV